MGMFDEFVRRDGAIIQGKFGPCVLRKYEVGDHIDDATDGVHEASCAEGYIAIANREIVAIEKDAEDAWQELNEFRLRLGMNISEVRDNASEIQDLKDRIEELEARIEELENK